MKSMVLFLPLNTNHVLIFESIIKSLHCEYAVLCHDRISEMEQYYTEYILRRIGIPYRHLSKSIQRSPSDSLLLKLINFFKMKKLIKKTLRHIKPDLIVFAIDNDPIAQIFIKEAKKQGIKTSLVQEGLIRPYEYTSRKIYFSDYLYKLLKLSGIYLSYIKYSAGNCDRLLVSGKRAFNILNRRGVAEDRMTIIGQPKYDSFLDKVQNYNTNDNGKNVYLFAASTNIVKDDRNIRFLKKIVESAEQLGLHLIIKLHPRDPYKPQDIYNIIKAEDTSCFEIIKEGDATFEILKRADALITVSSTVVLEALLINKECIVADYLAGESRLDYGSYDAAHSIESEEKIYDTIKKSMLFKKSYQNKIRLLEDELYKLDGQSGQRAARFIEDMTLGREPQKL